MVYTAPFLRHAVGSWLNGTVGMAGLGLGRLPNLIGSGLGLPLFRQPATTTAKGPVGDQFPGHSGGNCQRRVTPAVWSLELIQVTTG